jgi:hypothetical protein
MPNTVPKNKKTPVDNDGTVRLSPHARQRCAEMSISTKRVKRGMRTALVSAPTRHPGRTITVIDDEIAVVHANGTVITVLWAGALGRGDARNGDAS